MLDTWCISGLLRTAMIVLCYQQSLPLMGRNKTAAVALPPGGADTPAQGSFFPTTGNLSTSNSKGLPHWPVCDQDEQHLQLNMQPAVGWALKAHRLQFWTKTLPQKIRELMGTEERHIEL